MRKSFAYASRVVDRLYLEARKEAPKDVRKVLFPEDFNGEEDQEPKSEFERRVRNLKEHPLA